MEQKQIFRSQRKYVNSHDLKKRLFQRGVNNFSLCSIKKSLIQDKSKELLVNLTSNLKENSKQFKGPISPKINTTSIEFKKGKFMSKTINKDFYMRKIKYTKQNQKIIFIKMNKKEQQQLNYNFQNKQLQELKNNNKNKKIKKLQINKIKSQYNKYQKNNINQRNNINQKNNINEKNNINQKNINQKNNINEKHNINQKNNINQRNNINEKNKINEKIKIFEKQQQQQYNINKKKIQKINLQQYIKLIQQNIIGINQFLYLIKKNKFNTTNNNYYYTNQQQQNNIYKLEIIQYQQIKNNQNTIDFQYYTISKKGFCHYVNGKPIQFIDLEEWIYQKNIYEQIINLKFFNRFRKWKAIKMWKKKIVRHRIQQCSANLQEKLFYINPLMRQCLLQIRQIGLQMQNSVVIISKNEGSYSLQKFKCCQQKTTKQASNLIQKFSMQSRQRVNKCFENNVDLFKEILKSKNNVEEKSLACSSYNPKDNAFQALGFPSKLSYESRSRLRKMAGKFVRFSYLIDMIHTNTLANIFNVQTSTFISQLQQLQLNGKTRKSYTKNDKFTDEQLKYKIFDLQMNLNGKQIPLQAIKYTQVNTIDLQDINNSNILTKFHPTLNIKQKNDSISISQIIKHVPQICKHWLKMRPNLQTIYDEMGYVLKQSLNSLKCFERWSKHRDMQKYINILQQWDNIVCDNWQLCQNDCLNPNNIIDSLDNSLLKIKKLFQFSQNKFNSIINQEINFYLNLHWNNQYINLNKLTSQQLQYPSISIEIFINYIVQQLQQFNNKIPNTISLGIFSVHLSKIKNIIIDNSTRIFNQLKQLLPSIVDRRTQQINIWFSQNINKIKQQIHNIDDFVRVCKNFAHIDAEFNDKKEICTDLKRLYNTLCQHKIQSTRRKDFEAITLKSRDQLEQLLITLERNIEHKSEIFRKQVSKYHIPNINKGIEKLSEQVSDNRYLKLNDQQQSIIVDQLISSKQKYDELTLKVDKCQKYLQILKLPEFSNQLMHELQEKIESRLLIWKTYVQLQQQTSKLEQQLVCDIDLQAVSKYIVECAKIVNSVKNQLQNCQIYNILKDKVQLYSINIPLLQGFDDNLSQIHWQEINHVIAQLWQADLKKKQFQLKQFLTSQVDTHANLITNIFQKAKVQVQLQKKYVNLQSIWNTVIVKSKMQCKYHVIINQDVILQIFDTVISGMAQILSNPFASSLKQTSFTYDSLVQKLQIFQEWIKTQKILLQIQRLCKLIDTKKLPDYSNLQTAQKSYKNIMKQFINRNSDNCVKINKLFISGINEKLQQININLAKLQLNFINLLQIHRKIYPIFYLFSDKQLLSIITDANSINSITFAAKRILPALQNLQVQGERIVEIVTIDKDKIIKNYISLTSQIQQILQQIVQGMNDQVRRNMRLCRTKSMQYSSLEQLKTFNIQFVMAINKVDFCHYTEISIQNQHEQPQALMQYYKAMKKQNQEDLLHRQQLSKNIQISKLDTILVQNLLQQECLNNLIKNQVNTIYDYNWLNQIRFTWVQNNNNADQVNIMVKKLHVSLKYGNELLGSQIKVLFNCDIALMNTIKDHQITYFQSTKYSFERFINAIGYKLFTIQCQHHHDITTLRNILIGTYYANYLPFITRVNLLTQQVRINLVDQQYFSEFRQKQSKKNGAKETDSYCNAIFMSGMDKFNINSSSYRNIQYLMPNKSILQTYLKVQGLAIDSQHLHLLHKLFKLIEYLEPNSQLHNICMEQFIDSQQGIINPTLHSYLQLFLKYIRPKISLSSYEAIKNSVEAILGLEKTKEIETDYYSNKCFQIKQILQYHKILFLTAKGSSNWFITNNIYKSTHKIHKIYANSPTLQRINYIIQDIIKQNKNENNIIYFEGITHQLLNDLQQKTVLFELQSSSTYLIFDIQSTQILTPTNITSFALINCNFPQQSLLERGMSWGELHLPIPAQKKHFQLFFKDSFMMILNNWGNTSDILNKEQKLYTFLTILQSLLPLQNLQQAMVFAVIKTYYQKSNESIKMQNFVKKQLPEQKFLEEIGVFDLVYTPKNLESIQMYYQNCPQQIWPCNLVLTPKSYFYLQFCQKILNNTHEGISISGPMNSGKSTFLKLYKACNYQNNAYIRIQLTDESNLKQFSFKLKNVMQIHSLSSIKQKINYCSSIVLIDDVSMNESQIDILHIVNEMIKYKNWRNNKTEQNKYSVSNIKFILSGRLKPQLLSQSTVQIKLQYNQTYIKDIFTKLLTNCINSTQIDKIYINRIVNRTNQICKQIGQKNPFFHGSQLTIQNYIYSFFKYFHLKQHTIQQIQQYWLYILQQNLIYYDNENIIQKYLLKYNINKKYTIYSNIVINYKINKNQNNKNIIIQPIKDIKKLFNFINDKIDKYNQMQQQNYGNSFEFINFNELIYKIIKIKNNIQRKDYFLLSRIGGYQDNLIRLIAYISSVRLKIIQNNNSIKNTIQQILNNNNNINNVSQYYIYNKINNQNDIKNIIHFYTIDFQTEIINSKIQNNNIEKNINKIQKKNNFIKSQTYLPNNNNFNSTLDTNYILPKHKLTLNQVQQIRSSFKIIMSTNKKQLLFKIPVDIRNEFTIDSITQISFAHINQYNSKLLAVDQVQFKPKSLFILTKIYQNCKEQLALSLKANDDNVRLFSSFLTNLVNQMKYQGKKCMNIFSLQEIFKRITQNIKNDVQNHYQELNNMNQDLQIDDITKKTQNQVKQLLQKQLSKLNCCQNLNKIMNQLYQYFFIKYSRIEKYIKDEDYYESCLAQSACYFTFLSKLCLDDRKKWLKKWSQALGGLQITQLLCLFNLNPAQLSIDPHQDIPQYYQNMAIMFNSIKPVIIDDRSGHSISWLHKVCSFISVVAQDTKFEQFLIDKLPYPNNIIIQITEQKTMNNINNSLINNLLYLSDNITSIKIGKEQVNVNKQVKVYLLPTDNIQITPEMMDDFVVVIFHINQNTMCKELKHKYMSILYSNQYWSELQIGKKYTNAKLQCDNLKVEVSEMLDEYFQIENNEYNESVVLQQLDKIPDTMMTTLHNMLVQIKDKELKLSSKQQQSQTRQLLCNQFIQVTKKVLQVLQIMSSYHQYYSPSPYQLIRIIEQCMKKGIIKDHLTLLMFSIQFWSQQYTPTDSDIYLFLLIMRLQNTSIIELKNLLQQHNNNTSQKLLSQLYNFKTNKNNIDNNNIIQKIFGQGKLLTLQQIHNIIINHLKCILQNVIDERQYSWLELTNLITKDRMHLIIILKGCKKQSIEYFNKNNIQQSVIIDKQICQNDLKKIIYSEINILIISTFISFQQIIKILNSINGNFKTIYFIQQNNQLTNIKYNRNIFICYKNIMHNQQNIFNSLSTVSKMSIIPVKDNQQEMNSNYCYLSNKSIYFRNQRQENQQKFTDSFQYQFIQKIMKYLESYQQLYCIPIIKIPYQTCIKLKNMFYDNEITIVHKRNFLLNWVQSMLGYNNNIHQQYIGTFFQKIKNISSLEEQQSLTTLDNLIILQLQNLQQTKQQYNQIKQKSNSIELIYEWIEKLQKYTNGKIKNKMVLQKYLQQIKQFILQYEKQKIQSTYPQIQNNSKKEKLSKKSNENQISKGRKSKKLQPVSFESKSKLSFAYIMRAIDQCNRVIQFIKREIFELSYEIRNNQQLSIQQINKLVMLMNDKIPVQWSLFMNLQPNMKLSQFMRKIISSKISLNQHINENMLIDASLFKDPIWLIRGYMCGNSKYMLSLDYQNNSNINCMIVLQNIYAVGWKFNIDGYIEVCIDEKNINLIKKCYLIKKLTIPNHNIANVRIHASKQLELQYIVVYVHDKKYHTHSLHNIYLHL